jgi:ABC-type glycerol-3-phosphate transport system permease component
MSQQFVICLIAVAVNLIGMMAIYAAMSHAVARRHTLIVVALILISQLFWIVPGFWVVETRWIPHAGAYTLWLGNWLVCGFSLVIFRKSVIRIPVSLADTARMDGIGGFTAWRQTVLPFFGRDLGFIAFFTIMATLLPFSGCMTMPEAGHSIAKFESFLSPSGRLAFMTTMSVVGFAPLIAIFFIAKRNR